MTEKRNGTQKALDKLVSLGYNESIKNEEWFLALGLKEFNMRNEKIYDAYEIACLMDAKRLCSDLLSSLLRLNSVTNAHYVNNDIFDKSQAARKAVEDLAIELGISICNIEDGIK